MSAEEGDPSMHRLEASAPATGGLVIKKKDSDSSVFKVPKPSLLGLDRLAEQKRKENDQKRLISFKETEYDDDVESTPGHSAFKTPDQSSVHKLSRHYRETLNETPSHGGGVSEKARGRLAERTEKDKRGVFVSTKDEKKSRSKDDYDRDHDRRDRDKNRERDRDRRDRDRDRNRDSERRRERDRDYNRRSERSSKDTGYSSRAERRKQSDSERSLHTPRFRDEPRTPYTAATASSSWDDDDEKTSSKRSAWDFPTPKDGGERRSEWSTRSNTSSIYRSKKSKMEDDTPRPTPAHKYNAWANDRKRTGATPHTSNVNFNYLFIFQCFPLAICVI